MRKNMCGTIILMVLCFAFSLHPIAAAASYNDNPQFNDHNFSAYSDEELFALQAAISNELNNRRRVDYYENGELAYVQTEWGNYFFGVTKAVILPETDYRDAVYQITWECRNENFLTDYGDVLNVDFYSLAVSDSHGQTVPPMLSWYANEAMPATAAPGKSCIVKHIFAINDPSCEYLDVFMGARGISCRIKVENPITGSKEEPKTLKLGEKIRISNSHGEYEFQIDNAQILDWPHHTKDRPGTIIVTLQGILENLSSSGSYKDAISTYDLANNEFIVTDQEGFALEYCNGSGNDGLYEVGAKVMTGTKKRVSIPFYASETCNAITILIGNQGIIEIPLLRDNSQPSEPIPSGEKKAYSEEEINAIVNEILQCKNGETERAWKLINEYSEYMTDEQLKNVLLSYGKWKSFNKAEAKLKTYLKSPRSYYLYLGYAHSPVLQEDGSYKVEIDIEYGATNSFGAEVKNNVTMYSTFTIDLRNASVSFKDVDLSPYDKWAMYN